MSEKDNLKVLCDKFGIGLIYTDNDYTILSITTSDNTPILKAYIYFKGCSEALADSIINYYTSEVTDSRYADEIYDQMGESIFYFGCVIDPPTDNFRKLLKVSETN